MLLEADLDGSTETDLRYFVYGNYIDEPLLMVNIILGDPITYEDYYYVHDHLYSPVALLEDDGTVAERYEYDAYGNMTMLNSGFTTFTGTEAGNPYYFTGRRLDTLDGGDLEIMHYRFRYYKPSIGRFMQNDPLGLMVSGDSTFNPSRQYSFGSNLYQYLKSRPFSFLDPYGLFGVCGSGAERYIVPDGWRNISWVNACQGHDDCYGGTGPGGCSSSKNDCDRQFHMDMWRACQSARGYLPSIGNTYPPALPSSPRRVTDQEARRECKRRAAYYALAVDWYGGDAFKNAREKAKRSGTCCSSHSPQIGPMPRRRMRPLIAPVF